MGNVILRYDPEAMLRRYTDSAEDIALCIETVFNSPEWRLCDRGDGYREELLPPCMAKLPERLKTICEDICFRDDLELSFMPPVEGMEELIRSLKENGYGIWLLSNVGLWFPDFSKKIPVFSLFDGLFASSAFHMLKPDREIYETFLTHFGLTPAECVFIDDTPANCAGAEAAGMSSVCFNGKDQPVPLLRRLLQDRGIRI